MSTRRKQQRTRRMEGRSAGQNLDQRTQQSMKRQVATHPEPTLTAIRPRRSSGKQKTPRQWITYRFPRYENAESLLRIVCLLLVFLVSARYGLLVGVVVGITTIVLRIAFGHLSEARGRKVRVKVKKEN